MDQHRSVLVNDKVTRSNVTSIYTMGLVCKISRKKAFSNVSMGAYTPVYTITLHCIWKNSTVAWSQVHDVKGGLCMWPAPIPRKKRIGTETDTEEKQANGARGNLSGN